MKKSLLLLALGLSSIGTYAQDDDVYFVPSAKDKVESRDTYTSGHSSYTPIETDNSAYESSTWADNRGNGKWDVDAYNRRGPKYKGQCYTDTTAQTTKSSSRQSYDEGYDDGYDDGYFTSRLVRFWSPRIGVCVSSPYYWDYYDYCYDPFYYGYGSPWSWGWSGWYGWGSWYGWRPYYSSWYGWGGWYDPWWGGSWAWHRPHFDGWHFQPNPRGFNGGYFAGNYNRGGAARSFSTVRPNYGSANRPSRNFGGFDTRNSSASRSGFQNGTRPSRQLGNSQTPSRQFGTDRSNRSMQQSQPSRSFSQPSQSTPSRSFGTPSRSGGFSGGGNMGGGGRSFGGGGGGGRSFGGRR